MPNSMIMVVLVDVVVGMAVMAQSVAVDKDVATMRIGDLRNLI